MEANRISDDNRPKIVGDIAIKLGEKAVDYAIDKWKDVKNWFKRPDNLNTEDAVKSGNDVKIFGNPDNWKLHIKASSVQQGWMKSTKVMKIGKYYMVQVTSEFRNSKKEVTACGEAIERVKIPKNPKDDPFNYLFNPKIKENEKE